MVIKICELCGAEFKVDKYREFTAKFCSVKCRNKKHFITYNEFMEKVFPEPNTGCWLWAGSQTKKGYGQLYSLTNKRIWAHRLSYEFHIGIIPDNKIICHTCDQRICVNPDHLFLGTNTDNVADMVKKNRHAKGETCGVSKLTNEQVLIIRESKLPCTKMSVIMGVSNTTIKDVRKRRIWKHI